MENKVIYFSLSISAEQYLAYYQGKAHYVVVNNADGLVLKFPANRLRPFLSSQGIYGDFAIHYDSQHKIKKFIRCDHRLP